MIPHREHHSPFPAFVHEIRPHQQQAVTEILESYADGNEVVFCDAPTGSGKTLIGEIIRRELADTPKFRVLYVCSDKGLQDQFLADFPYARVLKGRGNYLTEFGGSDVTCDDCTIQQPGDQCMWCDSKQTCPYELAKTAALGAEIAVVNTAYMLSEANYVGKFSGFDLMIVDEADTLESMLMGFTEFQIPGYVGRALSLKYPVKGARKKTIIKWLEDLEIKSKTYARANSMKLNPKEQRRWRGFTAEVARVAMELQKDIDASGDDAEDVGRWLRDYDTKTFMMKPVIVSPYGPKNLWRHAKKFLLMSATVISADEMADSLGLPFDWAVVSVPMTFPVENRPIVVAPVANVTRATMEAAVLDLGYAIREIIRAHPGERVLVHTVSYALTDALWRELRPTYGDRLVTYRGAKEREGALAKFLATDGGVLLSPSMERGVDMKNDACRVVVVAKCPFPSLGDRRVKARQMLPGGQQWYTVQTIRDIVQMTGRAVRSETDWAKTYILDAQFTKNVWKNKDLFPVWWREAVDMNSDVRWLMRSQQYTAKSVVK